MAKLRKLTDKWYKTTLMRQNDLLRQHMPDTAVVTKQELYRMLAKYGMVYVKPARGSQGNGVIRMERGGGAKATYRYQLGKRRWNFSNFKEAYRSLSNQMKGKRYIVQQGIRLLRHKGRAFDIRHMIQRTPSGDFAVTGTLARVAAPSKIVTNGSQGGSIYATDAVLRRHTNSAGRSRLHRRMDQLAQRTVQLFREHTDGVNELGMDYAVDGGLKPWILEVNTKPDAAPFTLLADRSIVRRIARYGRRYGRRYNLVAKKAKRGR